MRRAIMLALLAAAVVPMSVGAAGKPIHTNFDDTFTDTVCGLDVSGESVGVDNFTPIFDSAGNVVSFKDTGQAKTTFTRNGKSLVVSAAGDHTGTATGDFSGLVTFTDNYKGLPERISYSNGSVITRDAGIITIQQVVDFSTGELVSSIVTVQKGPHPEADANFDLFCQVFTQVLG